MVHSQLRLDIDECIEHLVAEWTRRGLPLHGLETFLTPEAAVEKCINMYGSSGGAAGAATVAGAGGASTAAAGAAPAAAANPNDGGSGAAGSNDVVAGLLALAKSLAVPPAADVSGPGTLEM